MSLGDEQTTALALGVQRQFEAGSAAADLSD